LVTKSGPTKMKIIAEKMEDGVQQLDL